MHLDRSFGQALLATKCADIWFAPTLHGSLQSTISWRSYLPRILEQYTSVCPSNLSIEFNKFGKPFLANGFELYISVSHSNELTTIAIGREGPLGIDIEENRLIPEAEEIYTCTLLPFFDQMLPNLRPKFRSFLEAWTAAEAVLKMLGCGLAGLGQMSKSRLLQLCELPVDTEIYIFQLGWFRNHCITVASSDLYNSFRFFEAHGEFGHTVAPLREDLPICPVLENRHVNQ